MSQIICKDLTIGYDRQVVLEGINFEVNKGDYLCIVGENGSGKSTLMKTLLGLTPCLSGEIVFGDELRQTELGYLPQQTEVQKDFPASVKEIVLSGCQSRMGLRPFYNKEGNALVFKRMINGYKVYIKIKIESINDLENETVCLSFHIDNM